MTTMEEIFAAPREMLTVRRVFGDPIEKNGTMVIPVASVRGGGGGGMGSDASSDEPTGEGSGGGFGVTARPVGVYVVHGDEVDWKPAVDITRLAIAGIGLMALMTIAVRTLLKRR